MEKKRDEDKQTYKMQIRNWRPFLIAGSMERPRSGPINSRPWRYHETFLASHLVWPSPTQSVVVWLLKTGHVVFTIWIYNLNLSKYIVFVKEDFRVIIFSSSKNKMSKVTLLLMFLTLWIKKTESCPDTLRTNPRSIEKMIPALLTTRENFTYPDCKHMD